MLVLSDLRHAIQLRLMEIDASRFDEFEPEEINFYLSEAELAIVKEIAQSQSPPALYASDLRTLIKEVTSTVLLGDTFSIYPAEIPDDFMYYIESSVLMTRTLLPVVASPEYFPATLITEGDVQHYRVTPINKPWIEKPGVLMRDDTFHIHTDQYSTPDAIKVSYLCKPTRWDDDESDYIHLPDHYRDKLVEGAIQLMSIDATPKQ